MCRGISIFFISFLLAIPYASNASNGSNFQQILNEDVRTRPIISPSQMQLLQPDEVETLGHVIVDLSAEHLDKAREDNNTLLGLMVETHRTTQEGRYNRIVSWLNFHNFFAGKAKGVGYGAVAMATGGWIASLTLESGSVQHWLAIGSSIAGPVGVAIVYLGGKSQEAGLRLENSLVANIARAQHTQSIYDREISRRSKLAAPQLLTEETHPLLSPSPSSSLNNAAYISGHSKDKEDEDLIEQKSDNGPKKE